MKGVPTWITTKTNYRVVPGSFWNSIKTVVPGPTGEPWDESWEENDNIRLLRSCKTIFVNDIFMDLWNIEKGLLFLDGGYGSSKTTYVITRLLVKCMENKYFKCFFGRQKKTEARELYSNIIREIKRNGWEDQFEYSEKPTGVPQVLHKASGNKFVLFGCDDVDSLKGIDNPTDILVDEVNQIDFASFGMLITRLRGSGYPTQFIGCFNNCDVFPDHWLRKFIYGNEMGETQKEKAIVSALKKLNITRHHSRYTDNFFQNPADYYNKLVMQAGGDEDRIRAICEGEWAVQIGQKPYYKGFKADRDVDMIFVEGCENYNTNLPIHVSWDENVNPYLPVSIWQRSGKTAWCIDEIAAESPNNTLEWCCREILRKYGDNKAGCYVYGDATSKKEDVKQEKGKNFFILALEYLRPLDPTLRVPDSNPNNAIRGNFINAIFSRNFEGIRIIIGTNCTHMKDDLKFTQESPDGKGKLKQREMVGGIRGVQRWGHFGDTLDYFICESFSEEYAMFQAGAYSFAPEGGGRSVSNTYDKPIEIEKPEKKNEEDWETTIESFVVNYGSRRSSKHRMN